jgi:hypothetical protein
MRHAPALIAAAAAALALAGCASSASPSGGPPPPTSGAATPSAAALAAPSSSPSPQLCTTHTCIARDIEQGLTGAVAKDESVITKVTCYKSTVVFHKAADTWSASCTATYSDGSSVSGTGNLLVSQQQVTFTPAGV